LAPDSLSFFDMSIERSKSAEQWISKIDSDRFGYVVARMDSFSKDPLADIAALQRVGVELAISRVPSANISLINKLECAGFRLKDCQWTMDYRSESTSQASRVHDLVAADDGITIDHVKAEEAPAVGALAFQAFRNYGHYAANPRLDPDRCNEVYRDWATRSCLDRSVADHVLVARSADQVVGFLTLKYGQVDSCRVAIQHLGAVDPRFRNRELFRRLVIACISQGQSDGILLHRTFLQITNLAVIRSYLKMGFLPSDSHYTLHAWLRDSLEPSQGA
jgi:GNAT superfamily N-acetyltransferase